MDFLSGLTIQPSTRQYYENTEKKIAKIFHSILYFGLFMFLLYGCLTVLTLLKNFLTGYRNPENWVVVYDQFV